MKRFTLRRGAFVPLMPKPVSEPPVQAVLTFEQLEIGDRFRRIVPVHINALILTKTSEVTASSRLDPEIFLVWDTPVERYTDAHTVAAAPVRRDTLILHPASALPRPINNMVLRQDEENSADLNAPLSQIEVGQTFRDFHHAPAEVWVKIDDTSAYLYSNPAVRMSTSAGRLVRLCTLP